MFPMQSMLGGILQGLTSNMDDSPAVIEYHVVTNPVTSNPILGALGLDATLPPHSRRRLAAPLSAPRMVQVTASRNIRDDQDDQDDDDVYDRYHNRHASSSSSSYKLPGSGIKIEEVADESPPLALPYLQEQQQHDKKIKNNNNKTVRFADYLETSITKGNEETTKQPSLLGTKILQDPIIPVKETPTESKESSREEVKKKPFQIWGECLANEEFLALGLQDAYTIFQKIFQLDAPTTTTITT